MKRKLNKKKVIICIIALIILITLPSFGRYIYNSVRDLYLKSQNFSFSSDLLTTVGQSYRYANWSGSEAYEIDFQLYSYENPLSLFQYGENGLEYSVTCEVVGTTKVTAHVGTQSGEATAQGYIPNSTNIKDIKIYIIPTENLEAGDTVKLNVTAKTTKPYKKTISATFNVVVNEEGVTYSIEDEPNSLYATLKLTNPDTEVKKITISFDPKLVVIDASDECFEDAQTSKTSINIEAEGVEYINSITFNMSPQVAKNIKFYKRNISADYTYPVGTYGSMVVSITESN